MRKRRERLPGGHPADAKGDDCQGNDAESELVGLRAMVVRTGRPPSTTLKAYPVHSISGKIRTAQLSAKMHSTAPPPGHK